MPFGRHKQGRDCNGAMGVGGGWKGNERLVGGDGKAVFWRLKARFCRLRQLVYQLAGVTFLAKYLPLRRARLLCGPSFENGKEAFRVEIKNLESWRGGVFTGSASWWSGRQGVDECDEAGEWSFPSRFTVVSPSSECPPEWSEDFEMFAAGSQPEGWVLNKARVHPFFRVVHHKDSRWLAARTCSRRVCGRV